MIDHLEVQLALRAKLATLSVASVTASISATETGYARASGSFLDDDFEVGMELVGSGFSDDLNNDTKTITAVAASTMDAVGCAVESAGTRTLTVGLPNTAHYEGIPVEPDPDSPWFSEQYVPGPGERIGIGVTAEMEFQPTYFVNMMIPAGVGMNAARRYQTALLILFASGTTFTVANASCRVRGNPAPFGGQLLHSRDPEGFFVVPVTVPLMLRTANSI